MKTFLTVLALLVASSTAHAQVYSLGKVRVLSRPNSQSTESESDYRQRLVRERDAAEAQAAANRPKYETDQQRYARLREQQRSQPAYLYHYKNGRERYRELISPGR